MTAVLVIAGIVALLAVAGMVIVAREGILSAERLTTRALAAEKVWRPANDLSVAQQAEEIHSKTEVEEWADEQRSMRAQVAFLEGRKP